MRRAVVSDSSLYVMVLLGLWSLSVSCAQGEPVGSGAGVAGRTGTGGFGRAGSSGSSTGTGGTIARPGGNGGGDSTGGRAGSGGSAGTSGGAGLGGASGSSGNVGGGGVGGSGGSAPQCLFASSIPVCDTCFQSECEQPCEACSANQSCLDLSSCKAGCTTSECVKDCETTHAAGVAQLEALVGLDGCQGIRCHEPCNYKCGLELSPTACSACADKNCYMECRACAREPECTELWDCKLFCAGEPASCLSNCEKAHAAGKVPLNAFIGDSGCLKAKCSSECGF